LSAAPLGAAMFHRHRRALSDQSSSLDSASLEAAPQFEVTIDSGGVNTPATGRSSRPSTSYGNGTNPEGWDCLPYKQYLIRNEVERANGELNGKPPYAGIVNELKNLGVRVYIVSYSSDDVLADIRHIVSLVSKDDRKMPLREKQRCLLYRDERDRVFNLKIRGESDGLANQWEAQLLSFSGFEAIVASTVLCRAFPCIDMDGENGVRPGYISLIIGLVLSEEIGSVAVNVSMLVRGMPSISAYALTHRILHDWPRKLIIFSLALASAAPADSATQRWITFFGIIFAVAVLASNLGSRAWYHLKLNPLAYSGPGAAALAFLTAMMTGIVVPFVGHREVQAGGKAAMEVVLRSAFLSALIFILSDIDEVQQFVIVGSEACNQNVVNVSVGIWYLATLMTSSFFVARIKTYSPTPEETEPVLVEDHSSPVGYMVPNLPVVHIDPTLGVKGAPCCSLRVYLLLAVVLGVCIAGTLAFMAFSDADDALTTQFFNFLP